MANTVATQSHDTSVVPRTRMGESSTESCNVSQSTSVTVWFRPESQQDIDGSQEILKLAYEKAMLFHQEQTRGRRKDEFTSFFEHSSLNDVLLHVEAIEQQYAIEKGRKSRITKSFSSGWTTTVSRINVFSNVIDVLVSTHPEYAAPVWGTIRFLLTVTQNHQELANKIAEAFSAISSALPELDFLANQLYPIPKIQQTLASMYTHIIDFCVRAIKWYHKARGNVFKKAFAAIKDPWALEFEDIVRQILQTTTRIREQAVIAHQAETRHISLIVSEVRSEVLNLREKTREQTLPQLLEPVALGIEATVLSPQPVALPEISFKPETVMKYLGPIPFDPQKTLDHGTAARDRRRARGGSGWDQIWTSDQLRDWISQPGPALVQLQGSRITSDTSRDFGFDMVELVKSTGLCLAWYLTSSLEEPMTVQDILRSFIQQVLVQNEDEFGHSSLSETRFASCNTDNDWTDLVLDVIMKLPLVMLILDSHDDGIRIANTVRKFWDLVHERKATSTTTIKMLLLTYPAPGLSTPALVPSDDMASFVVTLGQDRRPGSARAAAHGNPKVVQRRMLPRQGAGGGPSQLKPFMLQLLEAKEEAEDG